jgi:ABC-type dipeptide/oligopeptide/nickel transport system permease subunit
VYPAGVLIMLTVIAFNLVGDTLRETVDSRVRAR